MAHEKQGIVQPGKTPDVERKLQAGEKQAGSAAQTEALDDDATRRLAEHAAEKLRALPQNAGDVAGS